ncbi:aconitate hydratase [Allopusillimonas soli]|uniref:Aconitate hydratase n=1 Tax=Allopusillimonas soli TaxID=659016 RepID=A0A853FC31_9BURK|nr:aconitate hydratase [Allopusillimonas soli]NYT37633.1 aconitate hydratase [Allopusillimonas soli]TEA74404.1 aconitate hydratase [Allopusillimonas soli]
MKENLSTKLLRAKLVAGSLEPGQEIALRMDQALLQDVLGTLVMLELEAMGIERVKTQPTVQYIDHSLAQQDNLNADTHLFLQSACARFGIWYSGPGNGISHPVHMEYFGVPGQSLIGCDSHTPAAGSLGMLAIGAGGMEVALAMAGHPLYITAPRILGVRLEGSLPDWVSAKDVALEMLRRYGVSGCKDTMVEYYGPGLNSLSAMDRHVMANMGTEMGATSTLFPSDDATLRFLRARGREDVWLPMQPDPGCTYDLHDTIDLDRLEPLVALPSSPGNVVPVREAAGLPIYQAYIGSSGNPGYRDFAVVAAMMRHRTIAAGISLDINPSTRQVLQVLAEKGQLAQLIQAGARLHQAGCNGCIGMGQAPAAGRNSLRTVPRNFPGRSGTAEDSVFLCSPETAGASALFGRLTDPRSLDIPYPRIEEPMRIKPSPAVFAAPLPPAEARRHALVKTDNTPSLPRLAALPDSLSVPVLLRVDDDVSTDDIIPAGARVMPYWSNVYETAKFAFERLDESYHERATALQQSGGHAIVAGLNYGQGSSRENAALVPAYLGLRVVIARSFARIHWQNLVCFGVLPLVPDNPEDALPEQGAAVTIERVHQQLSAGPIVTALVGNDLTPLKLRHTLSSRQLEIIRAGGIINLIRMPESLEKSMP